MPNGCDVGHPDPHSTPPHVGDSCKGCSSSNVSELEIGGLMRVRGGARKGAAAQPVGPEPFLCPWRHVLQREIRKPVEHKRSQFWMETGGLR